MKEPLFIVTGAELDELIRQRFEHELPKLLLEARPEPDPFAAARARGEGYKRAELAKPENLTLSDAAQHIGQSEKWLNTLRQRGEFYALVEDGRERGFRYPSWQFSAQKSRLTPVLKALAVAGVECWGMHAFMQSPSQDLDGLTPREFILNRKTPVDVLIQLVERRYAKEQGAQ